MASASLAELVDGVASYLHSLDPEVLSGEDAAALTALFSRGEKLCATGRALTAKRAVSCNQHADRGHRSGEEWLASMSGTGRHQAAETLAAAEAMSNSPELDGACRSGDISCDQAALIARATQVDPASAGDLVDKAKSSGLGELKQACRAVLLASKSREEDQDRLARIHRGRYLRTWIDDEGAGRISGRLTPDKLARLKAMLHPFAERAYEQARTAGEREASDCYAADGLIDMAEAASTPHDQHIACRPQASAADPLISPTDAGSATQDPDAGTLFPADSTPVAEDPPPPRPAKPPATITVLIDLAALRRGWTEPGETCVIDGIGPVPLAAARTLMADAFWAAVTKDGIDIRKVVHLGRDPTAAQHTALMVRDRTCAVPGCSTTKGLEIDHVTGWVPTYHTTLDELARLCSHHHDLKSYDGWTLTGHPGAWQFQPPPHGPLPGPFDDDGIDLHPVQPSFITS